MWQYCSVCSAMFIVMSIDYQFTAATICSYPFTYNGLLKYGCTETKDQMVISDTCVPFYCLTTDRTTVKCYPSGEDDLEISSINVPVPPQPNITVISIGNWIVVQQRTTVIPSFNWLLPWSSYKNGFGSIGLNFWLGLERLHLMTTSSNYRIRIELQQVATNRWFSAEYSSFTIDSEAVHQYRLHVSG